MTSSSSSLSNTTNNNNDWLTVAAGATAWAIAIPAVRIAGNGVVTGGSLGKGLALIAGVGIAYVTTPILSMLLGWKTRHEKVRGVALVSCVCGCCGLVVDIFETIFWWQIMVFLAFAVLQALVLYNDNTI